MLENDEITIPPGTLRAGQQNPVDKVLRKSWFVRLLDGLTSGKGHVTPGEAGGHGRDGLDPHKAGRPGSDVQYALNGLESGGCDR